MGSLIYRIDPSVQSRLRLRLEEAGASKKKILYLSSLRALAQKDDGTTVEALAKIKARSLSGQSLDTASFDFVDIAHVQAAQILAPLVKSGRVFYEKDSIVRLIQGEISWQGEAFSKESCRLDAFILADGKKLLLSECRWLLSGEQCLALVGQEIIWIQNPLAPDWLDRARQGALCLDGRERKKFFEDSPKVIWKEKKEEPLRALPELVLHDSAGCFASLWMNYLGQGKVAFEDLSPWVGSARRLLEEEKSWEKDLLEAGYFRKSVGRSQYYCPADLTMDALSLLFGVGWEILGPSGKKARRYADWTCEIQKAEDGIALKGSDLFEPALKALRNGASWFETEQTSFWIDRKEALRLFGAVTDGEWKEGKLHLCRESLGALAGLLEVKGVSWDIELKQAAGVLKKAGGFAKAAVGAEFLGTLLNYQQTGLDWLTFLHAQGFGGLLADEMGLGKTVQILAFFSRTRTNLPSLIVAPSSLLYHWKKEFEKFLPSKKVYVHAGPLRKTELSKLCECPFILTSYGILRQDEELFRQIAFETLVFDESNAIKNSQTRTAKTALQLRAKARFCISGTPIENRVDELISQFAVLMPNLLNVKDPIDVVRKRVMPFMLRRKKSDVEIELPEKVEQIAWVEMTEGQKAVYDEFHKGALKKLKPMIEADGAQAHRMEVLEAILRLRQICCDPRLVGAPEEGAKYFQVLADLEGLMEENRKVLLYSQFTSMLDLIENECVQRGIPFVRIDGASSLSSRAEAIERFQQEPKALLFLLSLKAGGVGLNLTAADYVLLFDPWWNDAVERQAIDRAHRIGRKGTVFVKKYLSHSTIEEKMLDLKAKKQLAADQILDSNAAAGEPNFDEWLELLEI